MKYYDERNKELLYFKKNNIAEKYWDIHWLKEYRFPKNKVLKFNPTSHVCRITRKFLNPKDGPILEGGCGVGNYVFSLIKLGYNAIGVDNAKSTIKRIKKFYPKINIEFGDIRKLSFPDNYFSGYLSIGVIEHFFKSYDEVVKEMYRTLKSKGYLFLAIPYMSPFRLFKSRVNLYRIFNNELYNLSKTPKKFYQYALNKKKLIKKFENLGFILKYMEAVDGIKGFKDEIFFCKFFIGRFLQLIYEKNRGKFFLSIKGLMDKILVKFSGHMILLVLQKEE